MHEPTLQIPPSTPELAKINYEGASGRIQFDAKGDCKDAEMTIFT